MRTHFASLAVAFVAAACSQPHVGRLAPRDLPRVVDPGPATTEPGPTPQGPLAAGPEAELLPEVPSAEVTEADVLGYLQELYRRDEAAVIRLPPGETLLDRLRFCMGRVALKRGAEVLPELQRLASRHRDNPVVWRVTGLCHLHLGQVEDAIAATRQAFELDRPQGFKHCPNVVRELALQMLRTEAHRAEGERLLREELADGADFEWAAIQLADLHSVAEQHNEAIVCLDAALQRAPGSVQLHLRKAEVLMDLFRVAEAAAILRPLVQGDDAEAFALDCSRRCCLLGGDFPAAVAMTDRMIAHKDISDKGRATLRAWREELIAKPKSARIPVTMWFARLRGHPDIAQRLEALSALGNDPKTAARALDIGLASDVPLIRLRALQILLTISDRPIDALKRGLADADPKVRVAAADFAAELGRKDPTELAQLSTMVLETLAAESDPYAFRNLHGAMRKLTGADIDLAYGAEREPDQRASVVKAWRQRR